MQRVVIKSIFVLFIILTMFGASIIVPAIMPASAQCTPRADWSIYAVVSGDTLYGIARRYATTPTALIQGNCLINPNILLVGQPIRVPYGAAPTPWPGNMPEYPYAASQVGSTFQQFEHGFMTWRADTGSIWVFIAQGRDSGIVSAYPLSVYGRLSGETRYWQAIPPGLGLPNFGFKKVYDNFPDVRAALGWTIGGEQGFLMAVQPYPPQPYFTISLPDQRTVRINTDRTWTLDLGSPPPPPTYATGATFQPFQNGFMIWRADTGDIWVYVGASQGTLTSYALAQYGSLPNPIFAPPSPGYWFPVEFGFGKVWSSIPGVRDQLGWATGGEQGYTLVIEQAQSQPAFNLPDGLRMVNLGGNTWAVSSAYGTSDLPFGEVLPTPTPPPGSSGPQVSLFAVSPEFILPGDTLSISWEVYNAGSIGLTVKYQADYRLFLDYTSEVLPASGSTTIPIPTHTDVFNTEATLQLYWAYDAAPENWQIIDGATRTIFVSCPYPLFWNMGGCAQAPAQELPAVYQPFERGFMIRINESVYPVIFNEEHQATIFSEIERVELGTPPEGLYAPDAALVDTWTSSPLYRELLGWATAPAQFYSSRTQTENYHIRQSNVINNFVTLPDGQVLMLSGSLLGGPAIRWDWAGPE